MKKIITALITVLMLAGSYKASSQVNAGISFNTFYTELSPYGRWVNYPEYGQVWISNERGFEPYSTNGHWEFTNYGWMWVSDYAWGWAPFHYGRWAYLNSYGWAWVPGYDWAPAWVGWCNYDGYYGWAPLSPGVGFNYSFNSIPYNYWRFVRPQYINNPHVYRHFQQPVINSNQYNNVTVINNTVVNNNITYNPGPSQQQVEGITRKKLEPKQVAFSDHALTKKEVVDKKQIRVFRPTVEKNAVAEKTDQPATQQPVRPAKAPAVQQEQPVATQQPVRTAKQSGIIKQQPAVKDEDNTGHNNNVTQKQNAVDRQQELINQQQELMRKQQLEQLAKEDAIKRQQQNDAKQQEMMRRQQQQRDAQQEEMTRRQQQNDARQRQQEAARQQEQIRQQRQNEIRQQKAQPQLKQQQWTEPSFPKQQSQPVRQTRKATGKEAQFQ